MLQSIYYSSVYMKKEIELKLASEKVLGETHISEQ